MCQRVLQPGTDQGRNEKLPLGTTVIKSHTVFASCHLKCGSYLLLLPQSDNMTSNEIQLLCNSEPITVGRYNGGGEKVVIIFKQLFFFCIRQFSTLKHVPYISDILHFQFKLYCIFCNHLVPYTPSPQQSHTVVHVHESINPPIP